MLLYIFVFLHQTTTCPGAARRGRSLYIFVFLHQTTTITLPCTARRRCISLFSYIKPQPHDVDVRVAAGCISLFSYIKPQQRMPRNGRIDCCISLFSYIKPQPIPLPEADAESCISLFSYIKPQLPRCSGFTAICCISLFSYIKPQPFCAASVRRFVVYLCFPTSNHNKSNVLHTQPKLYIFVFLHQTTTYPGAARRGRCCISLFSYIKPQLVV